MAGKPAIHGARQNGQPRRNTSNPDFVAGFLNDQIGAAWFRRREEDTVGSARNVFVRAEDADVRLHFVVIRREVVVSNWPIVAQAVARAGFEVDRCEAQGDSPPMICPAPNNPRTEPLEVSAGSRGVWFAFDVPGAVGSQEFTKIF